MDFMYDAQKKNIFKPGDDYFTAKKALNKVQSKKKI